MNTLSLTVAAAMGASLWVWTEGAVAAPEASYKALKGLHDVEDIIAINDDWVIGSSYSANGESRPLYLINVKTHAFEDLLQSAGTTEFAPEFAACPGAPDLRQLSPHGVDYYPEAHRFLMVNHRQRESVESFHVGFASDGKPMFTWNGCVVAPKTMYLDAIAGINGNEMIVSSLWDPTNDKKVDALKSGRPQGALYHWTAAQGFTPLPGSKRFSAPNGVLATRDGNIIYVALWSGREVARMVKKGNGYTVDAVKTGFLADNLRWTPSRDGIYVGGQEASVEAVMACSISSGNACPEINSRVALLNPDTLVLTPLVPGGGRAGISAGTGAIRVGDELWLSTIKNTKIGIVPAE